ncbi:LPS export ABC transporter periplasmic protein LptC [Hydrogenophaga sp.]|uniref:LPS export ABC transporter periplasmic protein LptC n=1 Tax=Hydrogenophaga sp. TaxID=1904254 RepID=UPI0027327DC7|nr:LPS export ABC transporter periplasmic protein LptC [Hydrogenophaga sp.]MDP3477710.1 LPS export ABC transporter periplasmic protein LptC [Hydrogenophaga sp.]
MHTPPFVEKARAWLPLLPLLLLLLATYWLNQQVLPLPQKQSQQRHDIDYSVDRFSAVSLNKEGQPRYIIAAERLWHYPDDDSSHLQMPLLTSLHRDRPPTVTSARTGMISSKGDDVYLYDEVRIVRDAGNGVGEQRFATDYLHIVPDRDWADTDQSVVVTDRYNVLRAVGMELDNQARTVKLLSRVRANHEPIRE